MSELWRGGRMLELSAEECRSLVEATSVGRVAWCAGGEPVVLPVNYRLADDAIWLRTGAGTRLAREIDDLPVAFEVDEADPFTRSGWSVLVRARAEVANTGPDLRSRWPDADSWPEGVRWTLVRIPFARVSGRRLLPS